MRCRSLSRGHRQTGNPQVTALSSETPLKPWKYTRPALYRLHALRKVKQDLVVGVADDGRCRRCLHECQLRQKPICTGSTVQLADGYVAVQLSCAFSRPDQRLTRSKLILTDKERREAT